MVVVAAVVLLFGSCFTLTVVVVPLDELLFAELLNILLLLLVVELGEVLYISLGGESTDCGSVLYSAVAAVMLPLLLVLWYP